MPILLSTTESTLLGKGPGEKMGKVLSLAKHPEKFEEKI